MTPNPDRQVGIATSFADECIPLLHSARGHMVRAKMIELDQALADGQPVTEILCDLSGMHQPESVVQESFLAGYQLDLIRVGATTRKFWHTKLTALGISQDRINRAEVIVKQVKEAHPDQPRQIEAIHGLCGEEYFLPPSDEIVDLLGDSPEEINPDTDMTAGSSRGR
ncbi:MAG: hypothetical protein HZC01_02630 [Candidatus Kerfeldbacteria bacterium]|nr:hypothetical protein [Candidatus Kerfeldbacteria bacterium]